MTSPIYMAIVNYMAITICMARDNCIICMGFGQGLTIR
jgi:hypothetical protein